MYTLILHSMYISRFKKALKNFAKTIIAHKTTSSYSAKMCGGIIGVLYNECK